MRSASTLAFLTTTALLALAFGPGCGGDSGTTTSTTSSSSGGGEGDGGGDGQGGAASTSSGSGQGGTPLVVVNWNVRNLFDTTKDTTNDGEIVYSSAQYEKKMNDVAAILRELSPDVAILQEVENQQVLDDLAQRVGSGYVGVKLVEGNDFRGIDVGAFSKVQFDSVVSHKDDSFSLPGGGPQRFTRDCPEFHMTFAGRKIVMLGVHFRSKGEDDPDRRLAEAIRSRAIADGIAAADPEAGIIILGDYNDLPGSNPVEHIRKGPPAFLDAVDSVPEGDRWTFDFQGTLELIDHQMSNPVAAAWLDTTSVSILHGDAVKIASDHSPVKATYRVR